MKDPDLGGVLAFLRSAERLKHTTRSAWTSTGRQESVAEHSWRLALMCIVLGRRFPSVDIGRVLRMCIVHDLGEAIHGDIPAPEQDPAHGKAAQERLDILDVTSPLPDTERDGIVALWEEYEAAATPEARLAKGLDKLETILQHNQGRNPPGFDYSFNLGYGRQYTTDDALIAELRSLLDAETTERARAADVGTRARREKQ